MNLNCFILCFLLTEGNVNEATIVCVRVCKLESECMSDAVMI